MKEKSSKKTPVLKETIHLAETIDEKGIYTKYKYRTVQQIYFYIRPIRNHFHPCKQCQEKLQEMLANGTWILGNRDYEPLIELNTTSDDVDEDYEETVEQRKATKEELDRIGLDGWEAIE